MNAWRELLECGHLRLDGPWDEAEPRHMIGDRGICEICPKVQGPGYGEVWATRVIVDVTPIAPGAMRVEESDG